MSSTGTEESLKPRKRAGRRIIKKLFIAVACGFLLAAVPLSIMIVPDQFRSVDSAPEDVWLYDDSKSAGKDNGEDLRVPDEGNVVVQREASPSNAENQAECSEPWLYDKNKFLTPKELAAKYRPFSDVSKLPEEFRESALKINECIDRLVALAAGAEGESLDKLQAEYRDILMTHFDSCSEFDSKKEQYADSAPRDEAMKEALRFNWRSYPDLWQRVNLLLSIRSERWDRAASICGALNETSENWVPDYGSRWWEWEVYYWRKAGGLNGRCCLAWRSAAPIIGPVEKRFEEWTQKMLEPILVPVYEEIARKERMSAGGESK